MRRLRYAVILVALLVAVGTLGFKVYQYRFRLALLPEAFGASRIVHAREKVYGFGPGGNETGIIVYAMPERMAEALAAEGIDWLQHLADTGDRGRRGPFDRWQPTPVPAALAWSDPNRCRDEFTPAAGCPGIAAFLDRYGFGLPLRAAVESMVDAALFSPGAYWSAGPGPLLLVIPAERRIVFAHAG